MHIKSLNVKTIATVGVMAATLECGKLVLSFLPNIEVVSILTALYGFVFGWAGVLAAFIFVMIEPLIWGFGPWFITYLIYWPLLAFVFINDTIFRKHIITHNFTQEGKRAKLISVKGICVDEYVFTNGLNLVTRRAD